MPWGAIEPEPEVEEWLTAQPDATFGHIARHIDRLAELGTAARMPLVRHLRGKLWELRFDHGGEAIRISYSIAPGRVIVLLTIFRKQRDNERAEVERAYQAMLRCMTEHDHATPEEST